MPGLGQVYQLYVGNQFVNDLAPNEDIMKIISPDGTVTTVINAAGAVTGYAGPFTITSNSASALTVGRLGSTTPALKIDASTATSITGIQIKSAAAGGGVAVKAIGETNVALTINANGSGTIGIGTVSTGAVTITPATTVTGVLTTTATQVQSAGRRIGPTGAGFNGLGTPEAVTIASGVATVTRPIVSLAGEGATTDTLDSIVYTSSAVGDLLLVICLGAYTITFDNSATLLLGAGTRAMAQGSSMQLVCTASGVWREVSFVTATS